MGVRFRNTSTHRKVSYMSNADFIKHSPALNEMVQVERATREALSDATQQAMVSLTRHAEYFQSMITRMDQFPLSMRAERIARFRLTVEMAGAGEISFAVAECRLQQMFDIHYEEVTGQALDRSMIAYDDVGDDN